MPTLRELLAEATPGPWRVCLDNEDGLDIPHPTFTDSGTFLHVRLPPADARAIVALRNSAEALLDVVEAAGATVGAHKACGCTCHGLSEALDRLSVIESSEGVEP